MPVWSRLLERLNALPIGSRRVRVGGDWLLADTPDRFAASLAWKLGLLERRERRFLEAWLRPGMVAVDVGANIGFHTLAMARAVGETGRVYALEPEPRNFGALKRAVELAELSQVRLSQAAAAERTGPLALALSTVNRGDHRVSAGNSARETICVGGVALDELLADEPHVDLVKIDVQGSEADVLRGFEATLSRSPQLALVCELCPDLLTRAGASLEALLAPLSRAGLHPHLLVAGARLAPVDPEDAWLRAERSGHLNLVFKRTSAGRPMPRPSREITREGPA